MPSEENREFPWLPVTFAALWWCSDRDIAQKDRDLAASARALRKAEKSWKKRHNPRWLDEAGRSDSPSVSQPVGLSEAPLSREQKFVLFGWIIGALLLLIWGCFLDR